MSEIVDSFEKGLIKVGANEYGRKLIEFCCSKVVSVLCPFIDEKIKDGYFTRLTFDMMLAWERPASIDERRHMVRSTPILVLLLRSFIVMCTSSMPETVRFSFVHDLSLQRLTDVLVA